MGKLIRSLALLFALVVVGCGEADPAPAPGAGGSGGDVGTGGSAGDGGSAGLGGSAGMGGTGGSAVEVCTDDGRCAPEDDCVCVECDDDLFCGDPDNCNTDGVCAEFSEGCVCPDCASLPVCER